MKYLDNEQYFGQRIVSYCLNLLIAESGTPKALDPENRHSLKLRFDLEGIKLSESHNFLQKFKLFYPTLANLGSQISKTRWT